jgi:hypothetical protein
VDEELRVVRGPAEALDPLRDAAVLLRAVGPRDLPVGDVADERVRERELGLALDRGALLPAYEALALEGMEHRAGFALVASERSDPEHLAQDCGIPQELLLLVRKAVEPRRDDALERLRERELLRRSALEVELGELLRVQRVAASALEERLL